MYLTQNTYLGGADKIMDVAEKADKKLRQTNDLIQQINCREMKLEIEVNRYSEKSGIHVGLSGVNETIAIIQGAINGYEQVLMMLNSLSEMARELNEKNNQPS